MGGQSTHLKGDVFCTLKIIYGMEKKKKRKGGTVIPETEEKKRGFTTKIPNPPPIRPLTSSPLSNKAQERDGSDMEGIVSDPIRSARIQHLQERVLLGLRDGQVVDGLDLDPHAGVGAVVGFCGGRSVDYIYFISI